MKLIKIVPILLGMILFSNYVYGLDCPTTLNDAVAFYTFDADCSDDISSYNNNATAGGGRSANIPNHN